MRVNHRFARGPHEDCEATILRGDEGERVVLIREPHCPTCGALTRKVKGTAEGDQLVGTTLDQRYRLDAPLARGGHGIRPASDGLVGVAGLGSGFGTDHGGGHGKRGDNTVQRLFTLLPPREVITIFAVP